MSVYAKEIAENLRESIDSMLYQTVPPDDFVLVCDGPLPSPLWDIINQYENAYPELFQICKLPQNMGLGTALNAGLHRCKNDVVARMDSDDISLPDRCQRQLAVMEGGGDLVSGTILEFEKSVDHVVARRVLPETDSAIRNYLGRRNPFNHPCVMFRKQQICSVGGYRAVRGFEDYDLWVRMLRNGSKGYNLKTPLLYMRTSDDFYYRRGGLSYLRQLLKFRWDLLRRGDSSWLDFWVSGVGQSIVCLLPNVARKAFYRRLLRKK